jgi:hypothetical protein
MFKFLSIALLSVAGLLVFTTIAQAGPRRGCCCANDCCAAPAVTAPAPAPVAPATAQAPGARQTVRSYSYEPAAPAYVPYVRTYRSGSTDAAGNFDAGRKIKGL